MQAQISADLDLLLRSVVHTMFATLGKVYHLAMQASKELDRLRQGGRLSEAIFRPWSTLATNQSVALGHSAVIMLSLQKRFLNHFAREQGQAFCLPLDKRRTF